MRHLTRFSRKPIRRYAVVLAVIATPLLFDYANSLTGDDGQHGSVFVAGAPSAVPDHALLMAADRLLLVRCQAACSNPASWVVGNETQITVASFDSRLAPVARGFFLGDYVGLDDTETAFAALYTEGVSATNPTDEFYATVPVP